MTEGLPVGLLGIFLSRNEQRFKLLVERFTGLGLVVGQHNRYCRAPSRDQKSYECDREPVLEHRRALSSGGETQLYDLVPWAVVKILSM